MADSFVEFQYLYDHRELMLLNLVGVVQHAIGNLNLNDSIAFAVIPSAVYNPV